MSVSDLTDLKIVCTDESFKDFLSKFLP